MKAIVNQRYGSPDILKLKDVAKPVPADGQVLVKVQAVSVNRTDWEGLVGKPFYARFGGLFWPRNPILGSDIAGRVEALGENTSEFQPGDEVFGEIPEYHGGFAEYACVPEKNLAHKPDGMTFEQAAAIPQAGSIAYFAICTQGKVQPGQKILINGAGGGTGMFAIQIAKLHGAEVTGVDNGGKMDFMRSLGADHVIDYTREDFAKSGRQYDLIVDLVAHRSVFAYPDALAPGGTYFFVGGSFATLFQVLFFGQRIKRNTGKNMRLLAIPQDRELLLSVAGLCQAGKITPRIDKFYPLSEVPEALRYLGEGHAKGKIVITLESQTPAAL